MQEKMFDHDRRVYFVLAATIAIGSIAHAILAFPGKIIGKQSKTAQIYSGNAKYVSEQN